jgi:hypothetical protein
VNNHKPAAAEATVPISKLKVNQLDGWISTVNDALSSHSTAEAVLQVYAQVTGTMSSEQRYRYRKNDLFGHLWTCYARVLERWVLMCDLPHSHTPVRCYESSSRQ